MNDGLLRANDGLKGSFNQVLTRLGEDLDHDIIGNEIFFDKLPDKVKVGLTCGRETDLYLLIAHVDQ